MRSDVESVCELPVSVESEVQLRVSSYDRLAGILVSLLILCGVAVATLFTIWVTASWIIRHESRPVGFGGRGGHVESIDGELEIPEDHEFSELAELEFEQSVTDALAAIPLALASLDQIPTPTKKKTGIISIQGDDRLPGPLNGPPPNDPKSVIPRWDRWEIHWTTGELKSYARQLDFFKIELGAAGGAPNVEYASNLSKPRSDRREGSPKKEKRLYMTWRRGTVVKFDRALLERAGIPSKGRIVMQFYPTKVEDQLARLEKKKAGDRTTKEFLKTVFGVRPADGDGYEFYVVDQRFRPAPP